MCRESGASKKQMGSRQVRRVNPTQTFVRVASRLTTVIQAFQALAARREPICGHPCTLSPAIARRERAKVWTATLRVRTAREHCAMARDPRTELVSAEALSWLDYDSTVRLGGTGEQRRFAFGKWVDAGDRLAAFDFAQLPKRVREAAARALSGAAGK